MSDAGMTEAKIDLAVKLLFGAFVLITTFLIILYLGGVISQPEPYQYDRVIYTQDGPEIQRITREALK